MFLILSMISAIAYPMHKPALRKYYKGNSSYLHMKRGAPVFVLGLIRKICPKSKRSQIWIETVIYTLIAFIMIGLVLGYVKPKIEELQDKAVIEQSVSMLETIDTTILTLGGTGNQRIIELGVKKGEFKIDATEDKLIFETESKYEYSEPEKAIHDGNIEIITKEQSKEYIVTLTLDYSGAYDITYDDSDELKTISKSPTAYKLIISNKGVGDGETLVQIDMKVELSEA